MNTITFKTESGDRNVSAVLGSNYLKVAQDAGIALDAPCGGNGSCGKCRVRLLEGVIESEDAPGLSSEDKEAGWHLTCKSTVTGDAVVELPRESLDWQQGMRVIGSADDADASWVQLVDMLECAGLWKREESRSIPIIIEQADVDNNTSDLERLRGALGSSIGHEHISIPLAVIRSLPGLLRDRNYHLQALITEEGEGIRLVALKSQSGKETPYGIACDIGTTSVSVALIDLTQNSMVAQASAGNAQIRFGADVINRIIIQSRPGGIKVLQDAIVAQTLNPLIHAVCKSAAISPDSISHMTVAGNTTMSHLFLGVEADPLRKEPFVPCFTRIDPVSAGEVGLDVPRATPIYIAPNVGSYVGGDITAGVLTSGLWCSEELKLFVDLGTNGELVFGNNEFLMTCACSAGPAFEGGDIEDGMRATDGAIEMVSIDARTFEPVVQVIGGGKPIGICGSGLIDLVSALFGVGAIDGKGRFIAEGPRFVRDEYGVGSYTVVMPSDSANGSAITLNEVDIENFVRAKGAIFSAITVMLGATGFSVEDISQVLVAGGIGSGIDIANAISIGLFPAIPQENYTYLGNTSLYGARAMVQSSSARKKVDEIASGMTYIELSSEPGYMDAFVAACFIPHTDATLFPSTATSRT